MDATREFRIEEHPRIAGDKAFRDLTDIEIANIRNAILFSPLGQKVQREGNVCARVVGTVSVVYTFTEFPDHTLIVLYEIQPFSPPTVASRAKHLLELIRLVRGAFGV